MPTKKTKKEKIDKIFESTLRINQSKSLFPLKAIGKVSNLHVDNLDVHGDVFIEFPNGAKKWGEFSKLVKWKVVKRKSSDLILMCIKLPTLKEFSGKVESIGNIVLGAHYLVATQLANDIREIFGEKEIISYVDMSDLEFEDIKFNSSLPFYTSVELIKQKGLKNFFLLIPNATIAGTINLLGAIAGKVLGFSPNVSGDKETVQYLLKDILGEEINLDFD